MTAVSLFDLLSRDRLGIADAGSTAPLAPFAGKLVAGSLADLQRLKDYEAHLPLASINDSSLELELRQLVWQLYREWADEATAVLARARSLEPAEHIEGIGHLQDAIGLALARLSIKPEQIVRAREQARQGQFIPARGMRDEFHAGFAPDAMLQFKAMDSDTQEIVLDLLDELALSPPSALEYVADAVNTSNGFRRYVFLHVTVDPARGTVTAIGVGNAIVAEG